MYLLRRTTLLIALIICSTLDFGARVTTAKFAPELYPDLRMVLPTHLRIVNQNGRTFLRFSSGIANVGDGALQVRAQHIGGVTQGIQEIHDSGGQILRTHPASTYTYHRDHKHWHMADVVLFEVRSGTPFGPKAGQSAVKISFCLIDSYKLGSVPASAPGYFHCDARKQGISAGWADHYHRSLPGQALDITGVPFGRYYLLNTANPGGKFIERDLGNNTAWVGFDLIRDNTGNISLTLADHSPCDGPGMCGELAPDRDTTPR
jgi:hypothetical protein